jgi:hypothetical protein
MISHFHSFFAGQQSRERVFSGSESHPTKTPSQNRTCHEVK